MLIASTLERLLEKLPLGEDEDDIEVGVEVAIVVMVIEDVTEVGVVASALMVVDAEEAEAVMVAELDELRVTLEELAAVEADAAVVPEVADVVDVGGVAVKRAVAAVGNTALASRLMRVQKSGRRPD